MTFWRFDAMRLKIHAASITAKHDQETTPPPLTFGTVTVIGKEALSVIPPPAAEIFTV
jgi:hypothetical protein